MTFIHDDVFFFPDILIYNNYNSFPVICHIKSCMNIEENFEESMFWQISESYFSSPILAFLVSKQNN